MRIDRRRQTASRLAARCASRLGQVLPMRGKASLGWKRGILAPVIRSEPFAGMLNHIGALSDSDVLASGPDALTQLRQTELEERQRGCSIGHGELAAVLTYIKTMPPSQ